MMQDHTVLQVKFVAASNGTALPSLALEKAEETIAGAARYTDTGGHRKVHHPILSSL
jgi:hypothetical protein